MISLGTAQALEIRSLLAVVAELSATDLGRAEIEQLEPSTDRAVLDRLRCEFDEASRLVGDRRIIPSSEVLLGEIVERLETARPPLSGRDLLALVDILRAGAEAQERIVGADPPCPELAAGSSALTDLSPYLNRVTTMLDRRGEVREDATPRLVELRGRIRSSRDRLYRDLSVYVNEHRDALSEDTIPMRGGRLVLMLQAGARGQAQGLVHGRSGTGRSFYFEPIEVVEANNTLSQAVEDEDEERRRVLAELLREATSRRDEIQAWLNFVAHLDRLQASVRFAELSKGRMAETATSLELRLMAARHPLLLGELAELRSRALGHSGHTGTVVPLDVELDAAQRVLVVTGPNAGGKTVALKTVGLLCLAHQCGLPIPVAVGTRLPVLTDLVATVGDEQDLLADRSTFSGRLLRLREAWESAGPRSLVLLDELGSGTDPAEGAALSVALLEGILDKGGLGVITTHLTPVAAAALDRAGACCAAMEFSSESGEPTFRLVPGPPGGSEAISLARRLGLPREWIERAEEHLGSDHRDLRRVIAEVEGLRQELAMSKERALAEEADRRKLLQRLEDERGELIEEKRKVGRRMKQEIDAFRDQTTRQLRQEIERLQKEAEGGRRKSLGAGTVARLFENAPQIEAETKEEVEVIVGGAVRHQSLGWEGTLESLERGRAVVYVRGKRIRCKEAELVGVAEPEPVGKRSPSSTSRGPSLDSGSVDIAPQLVLIGQRVEPALERLDDYLDQALLANRGEVRIVHGHGSGRLRQAIREHLNRHRAVADQRSGGEGEGGDGATIVVLRG